MYKIVNVHGSGKEDLEKSLIAHISIPIICLGWGHGSNNDAVIHSEERAQNLGTG
jgi:hypothetical protein